DRGEVHEHVRRPVIGGDETKALIGVEPLHCSCCHQSTSSVRHAMTRPAAPTASLPLPAPRYRLHPQSPSSAAPAAAPAQHPRPRQCPAPSPAQAPVLALQSPTTSRLHAPDPPICAADSA